MCNKFRSPGLLIRKHILKTCDFGKGLTLELKLTLTVTDPSGNDGTNRGHVDGGKIPIAVKCGDWVATPIGGRREVVKDCCWAGNRPVRPPEASDCHGAQAHVIDDKCTITASLLVRRTDDSPVEINLQWIHGDGWGRAGAHTSQRLRVTG